MLGVAAVQCIWMISINADRLLVIPALDSTGGKASDPYCEIWYNDNAIIYCSVHS